MDESDFSKEEVLKKLGKRIKEIRIAQGFTSYEYFSHMKKIFLELNMAGMKKGKI